MSKNLTTLFNVRKAIKSIIEKTKPILLNLTVSSTKESLEVINESYDAESWFDRNARISQQYSVRISESINTLNDNLKEDVRRSLARDASRSSEQQLEDLINDVGDKFDTYYTKERAKSIAVTNTNAVDNTIKRDSWKEEGATELQWITEQDDRVRPTHEALHGQRIPINSQFNVGGDTMPTPSTGSLASENVNCRCTMLPIMP